MVKEIGSVIGELDLIYKAINDITVISNVWCSVEI